MWFSGHKKRHLMKFQSVMTPLGVVVHLFGPYEGQRHDAHILQASGLVPQMQLYTIQPGGGAYSVYADSAYPLQPCVLCSFQGAHLTPEQRRFDADMVAVWVAVEWGFNSVLSQFSHLEMKTKQRILLEPVGQTYVVATLLSNCTACLYGNQVSNYFDLQPPFLEDYLHFS